MRFALKVVEHTLLMFIAVASFFALFGAAMVAGLYIWGEPHGILKGVLAAEAR
jgi:hypothetical protein